MTDLPPPDDDHLAADPADLSADAPADAAAEPGLIQDDVLSNDPPPFEHAAAAAPGPAAPPPPYGAYPSVHRLYRSRHDRKISGVSAGIAEYFRIDPTIVRLAMVFFILTGVGFLVYIAAWLIIPERPEGFVEPPRGAPIANERTMTVAFGIAALALAFGIATGSWSVLALALIGGGVWLLSEHSAVTPGFSSNASSPAMTYAPPLAYPPRPDAPMPYAQTPYAQAPLAGHGQNPPPAPGFSPTPQYPTEPVPVRERKPQRITWIVLSSLALLASIGIAAATGDWWNVSGTRFLGIGIVIIGVGIVVGQIKGGGARGLIPLGILAMLTLFPVSAVDGLIDEGVGETTYRPTTIAELEDNYEHGVGKLVVDLSELDFEGRSESVDIGLGIGELIVIVSQDTGGQAVLQAKAGEISHYLPQTDSVLFEEGVNIETGTVRLEGANGTLDLNIKVGLGTAELRSEGN